jgi:hypothetical protein
MTPGASRRELSGWWLTASATAGLYIFGAVYHVDMFGVDVPRAFGLLPFIAGAVLIFGVAALVAAINPRRAIDSHLTALVAAILSWPLFWSLRTNWLNEDGLALTPKFETDVPRIGAHLTHDELLELFLHSRVWYYTHQWWGWSVVHSYQVVSCTAGAAFVYVLFRLARRLAPSAPWLFLAGMFAGGYMQLFFGDVENYTITAALVALYMLAASRFLAGEVHLSVPAVTLATATVFHLEAGWLWPSALYLAFVSRRRRGDMSEATPSAVAACAILIGTFVYFQFHGLPLLKFFSSHAGHALRMNGVFAIGMPLHYYAEQLDLLLLLCPALVMIAPLALWRRFDGDETTVFLGVSAASMLLLQVVWRSQIGVLDDWNLYSIGGVLASLFLWRAIANAAITPALRLVAAALAATGWLHSYAWMILNHRYGR